MQRHLRVLSHPFPTRRSSDYGVVQTGVKNSAGWGHPDRLSDSAAASWVPRKGCVRPAQYVDKSCGRDQAPEPEWADSAQVGKPISSRLAMISFTWSALRVSSTTSTSARLAGTS